MVNGIPKNETVWVRRLTEKGEVFYTTSKDIRDYYFLYKIENDLDATKKPLKSGCGFRSYAEAFDVLLYFAYVKSFPMQQARLAGIITTFSICRMSNFWRVWKS